LFAPPNQCGAAFAIARAVANAHIGSAMTHYDYDLFVIGAGSGGVRAARIAASHGAKVALAEEYKVGGTCVIRGCVPKKLMVYAAQFAQNFADARGYGWAVEGDPQFNWAQLRDGVQTEVSRLSGLYSQTQAKAGVKVIPSRAVLESPHEVRVDGRVITAKHILIATGGRAVWPDAPGADLGITSNEVFHLPELPKRVLVAGGGYIATEFAGIFHGLGSHVTQLYRGKTLLKGWDMELRQKLQDAYVNKGITVHTQAVFSRIERVGASLRAHLSDGAVIDTDLILHAIGRLPNTHGLGLDQAGVALAADGAIVVDAGSRTSQPHIFAVGDVTGRVNLTPVAIREGHAVADLLFGNKHWQVDHSLIASAVFSQPPLASVGLTEEQARDGDLEIKVFRADFRPMAYTIAGRQERALMKLIVDASSDKVLGAHMLGPDAPEIIQMAAIALGMGATKADFDRTVALHPSAAEEFVLMR
jgi:glutathione reductase (NADPH)